MSMLNSYLRIVSADLEAQGFSEVPTSYTYSWDHIIMAGALGLTVAVVIPLSGGVVDRIFDVLKTTVKIVPFAEGATFNHLEGEIHFPNGGRIYFATRSNLDSLRGYDLKAIFVA
jgi:hypothetical protein